MLPQGLAADHPRRGAERVGHGEQQCDRGRGTPRQEQEEERRGKRGEERGGELLHHSRDVIQPCVGPAAYVQVTDRRKVERRDDHRHDYVL